MAFNLRARIVRSFQDAQLNFDQIASLLGTGVLRLLVRADLRLAYGTGSATFTASVATPTVTVAHGLGAVPVVYMVLPRPPSTAKFVVLMDVVDATNLQFRLRETTEVGVSVTQNYLWVAIG